MIAVSAGRCINKVHNQIACVTFTLPSVIFKKTIQSAYMHLNVKRGHSHHHQLTIRDVRYNMQMSISEEEVVATMEGHKEGKHRPGLSFSLLHGLAALCLHGNLWSTRPSSRIVRAR